MHLWRKHCVYEMNIEVVGIEVASVQVATIVSGISYCCVGDL